MKRYFLFKFVFLFILIITAISWWNYRNDSSANNLIAPGTVINDNPDYVSDLQSQGKLLMTWLDQNMDPFIVPSIAVGIVNANSFLFHDGISADIDTPFDIASLTKTFTAIVVLQLLQEGKFKVDDPIQKHLPGIIIDGSEIKSKPVTIRHLLSHTSGMHGSAGYVDAIVNGVYLSIPRQAYPAGHRYLYCNKGFVILKYLIEALTDLSYDENMSIRVFRPLGMYSSTAEYSNGTGGIITTVRDLANYTRMLLQKGRWKNRQLITEQTYNEMIVPGFNKSSAKNGYHYALSWEVATRYGTIESYYKAGRWYNAGSVLQIYPGRGIAFMYLCDPPNPLQAPFLYWRSKMTGRMRNIIDNINNTFPIDVAPAKLSKRRTPSNQGSTPPFNPGGTLSSSPDAILHSYAGEYIHQETGKMVSIELRGNKLFSVKNKKSYVMRHLDGHRFFGGTYNSLHNFEWEDNRVTGVTVRDEFYAREKVLAAKTITTEPEVPETGYVPGIKKYFREFATYFRYYFFN